MFRKRSSGPRSPFLTHMLTLVSGTAAAQIVGILLQPVLSRLYSPEVTGQMVVYTAVAGILISVAALRYDMTIMLPKNDDEARQLKRLATRSIIVTSLSASVVALIAFPFLRSRYGVTVASCLLVVGVSIFLVADSAAIQFWFNRKENYRAIAINRAQQTTGILVSQIALGFSGLRSVVGLLIGTIAGQLFAWATIFHKSSQVRQPVPENTPSLRKLAWRYRKMPLLNGPNVLVDAIRFNGIILLLTMTFGSAMGGEFSKAWALTEAPVALINGAIAQVFFQRLANLEPGQMRPLVWEAIRRAFVIGFFPFLVLYFVSPPLLTWYLGADWANAGLYAQALVPWLYVQLASSPISYIFVVTEKQQLMLGFAIFYAIVPLSFLWFTPYSNVVTIRILALIMAGMLLLMIALSLRVSAAYDREGAQ
ncbi:lipopolysaccharide biosynthesis protein [Actinomycetaceae bacterium TAE3-ERU4]|nr:lipopolysaccharide biosynthesis protein [Actinomycetaceae bacterium TAE3-ERU4]